MRNKNDNQKPGAGEISKPPVVVPVFTVGAPALPAEEYIDFPYDCLRVQSSALELRKAGVLFNEASDMGKQAKRDFEELLAKGYRVKHVAVENREFIFWWEKL